MVSANHKALGFLATQPSHIQTRNIMDNIKTFGDNIRNWPTGARKELVYGDHVDIVDSNDVIIGTATKLVLMAVSPVFRGHFENFKSSTKVSVSNPNIEENAIAVLLDWAKTMVHNPTAKFGVKVPMSNIDLIKLRYAAVKLGMQQYVSHFSRAYKIDLRARTPTQDECIILERLAVDTDDEFVVAVGERLGYLRRVGALTPDMIAALATFLETSPNMRASVVAADSRSSSRNWRH